MKKIDRQAPVVTVITNLTAGSVRLAWTGKLLTTLAPGQHVELPYEVYSIATDAQRDQMAADIDESRVAVHWSVRGMRAAQAAPAVKGPRVFADDPPPSAVLRVSPDQRTSLEGAPLPIAPPARALSQPQPPPQAIQPPPAPVEAPPAAEEQKTVDINTVMGWKPPVQAPKTQQTVTLESALGWKAPAPAPQQPSISLIDAVAERQHAPLPPPKQPRAAAEAEKAEAEAAARAAEAEAQALMAGQAEQPARRSHKKRPR